MLRKREIELRPVAGVRLCRKGGGHRPTTSPEGRKEGRTEIRKDTIKEMGVCPDSGEPPTHSRAADISIE